MVKNLSKTELESEYREKYSKPDTESPYQTSNIFSSIFSNIFFKWVEPILTISQKLTFQQNMHYNPIPSHKTSDLTTNFSKTWAHEFQKHKPQIPNPDQPSNNPPQILYSVILKNFKWQLLSF